MAHIDTPTTHRTKPALTPVAADLWIVDAEPLHAGGLCIPLRMTIVRLPDGSLWLHSPTQFSPELKAELDALGPIRHLIAPSLRHWMFLPDWARACPEALVWATPGLGDRREVQRAQLRIDRVLEEDSPPEWAEAIEQIIVRAPPYAEVAFFHKPTRSMLLTDLILNIDAHDEPKLGRALLRATHAAAPNGSVPSHLRMLLRGNRNEALQTATRLVSLQPDRVIFTHGEWFRSQGAQRLRAAFDWLLRADRCNPDEFRGATIVVTGASSGIGRATALEFARHGGHVVLAARRASGLTQVAEICRELGGGAQVVETDVTDEASVQRLASEALRRNGRIDFWVNNAGTGVFGAFQEADMALHRKTIEVNLIGAMNGAAAALPIFLRQRRGVLINNISMGGWLPTPYAAAYTASKFGLRGFTASLRAEMSEWPDIHVCGVFPSMIDTPGFAHGANVSGRSLNPGPLLYSAQDVAATIVSVARRPRDETAVGWPARAGQVAYTLARGLSERASAAIFRGLLRRADHAPHVRGALERPVREGVGTTGDWMIRNSVPPAGALSAIAGVALASTLSIGAAALAVRASRRRATSRPALQRRDSY